VRPDPTSFEVTLILPDGVRTIPVNGDQHIWDTAWAAGIVLPALCHQGRCLTCAGRLENSGEVDQSDSVSYFGDTKIVYAPKETLAALLVRQTAKKYPRLLGLKLFAATSQRKELHLVASNDGADLGRAATSVELDVVARDVVYCGRGKKETLVTLPLHDRNGDAIAAVRFVLQPYAGQTEQAALARAMPILRELETRVRSARDLTQ